MARKSGFSETKGKLVYVQNTVAKGVFLDLFSKVLKTCVCIRGFILNTAKLPSDLYLADRRHYPGLHDQLIY